MDASFIQSIFCDERTVEALRLIVNGGFLRVVNYHNTSHQNSERLNRDIKLMSEHFSNVSVTDLDSWFDSGIWHKEKPGIIPVVYEGWRNAYDVIRPILDAYGVKAWFFVPAFLPDIPVSEQALYPAGHHLRASKLSHYQDGRIMMNWDELRELSKNHEICCHTGHHFQPSPNDDDETLYKEIVNSKKRLEQELEKEISVFCWTSGDDFSYVERAKPIFVSAGYKYLVGNLKVERIG